jgi:uncharacterized protein (TIGR00288 family)
MQEEAPKSRVLASSMETVKQALDDVVSKAQQIEIERDETPQGSGPRKVAVFLDNPNIFIGSQRNNEEYDPAKMIEIAKQHGSITHALVYIRLSPHETGTEGWITKYRKLGFEPRFVIDYNHDNESKDVDTYLVADALETAYTTNTDVFVIASGDGDYVPLVNQLRKLGKKTVIVAHEDSLSRFLSAIADETEILHEAVEF